MPKVPKIKKGAYPESPSYHKKTPVGAASTTNTTCSFQITRLRNSVDLIINMMGRSDTTILGNLGILVHLRHFCFF
jgi:hypothetical protein